MQDFNGCLVTWKTREDPLKMKVLKWHFPHFKITGKKLTQSNNSNLVQNKTDQDFLIVLVISKNEEDPMKNEGTRVATTFLP